MPEPWIAVEAGHRRSKKLADLPDDKARYGFFVALGECKLLYQAGSFTPGQWRALMGVHARYLTTYKAVGLIHTAPNYCEGDAVCLRGRGPFPAGQLVIHNWSKYQREHAVRQAEYEARTDVRTDVLTDVETDNILTPSHGRALRAVAVPVSVDSFSKSRDEPYQVRKSEIEEPYATLERLTNFPMQRVEASAIRSLDGLVDRRGLDAVVAAMVAAAPGITPQPPAAWPLIGATRNLMEPFAAPAPRLTPKELEQQRIDAMVAEGRRKARAPR